MPLPFLRTCSGVVGFVDVHSYGEDLIMPGCDERKMTPSAKRKIDDMATAMAKGINSAHQQKYVTGTCQSLLGYEFTGADSPTCFSSCEPK